MTNGYDLEENQYGFRWGPMWVGRACGDENGGVVLRVATGAIGGGKAVYIRVSPKGRTITVEPCKEARIQMPRLP